MNYAEMFIGYNKEEDHRILICAHDIEEAQELAEEYRYDVHLDGGFDIKKVQGGIDDIHFDCEYVIV